MSIILGIDPGTRITGYGLITESYKLIDFGCIKPSAKLSLEKRYLIIFECLLKLIDQYHPSSIAVESQFVQKNIQSTLKLGMAKGTVLLAAAKKELSVFEYAPMQAKRAVVGTGKATKLQVQKMLQSILNLSEIPQPEDAADALSLAFCHAHHLKKRNFLCTHT